MTDDPHPSQDPPARGDELVKSLSPQQRADNITRLLRFVFEDAHQHGLHIVYPTAESGHVIYLEQAPRCRVPRANSWIQKPGAITRNNSDT